MPQANIIAIDGPAGSGKSSLGQRLSERLGYLFFDTGVMYRAVTWAALERGIPISDEAQVTALAQALDIDVRPPSQADGRGYDVLVEDQDVTWAIRTPEVDSYVSAVSAYPGVRQALAAQQRRIGLRGRVIMVGRDIGTVVLPEAELKIYLDASVEERARRRFTERCVRGEQADFAQVLQAMQARDQIDSTRQVSPLRPAEDAYLLCSDGLNLDQVVEKVLELLQNA
jgi:cytidylate kinase